MTPREVIALSREKEIQTVDLRFTDLFGAWQQVSFPVAQLEEQLFEDGVGVDGSQFQGWCSIENGDLLLVPESDTAFVDPLAPLPTLALICRVNHPATGEPYVRDPRHIARQAENFLQSTAVADVASFGPVTEFRIFSDAQFGQDGADGYYHLASTQAGRTSDCGHAHHAGGDEAANGLHAACADLPTELLLSLQACGLEVTSQRYSAATGHGAAEFTPQSLLRMADWTMMYKHVVRQVARQRSLKATFMPQPVLGQPGNAMNIHFSLWRDEHSVFAGSGYGGLSEAGLHAIGGILRHAPALAAFTNPTTNSYKRLAPGTGAPIHLACGLGNRSVACRIPSYSANPAAKRVEYRTPDASCNPYLAFAAITMAAIDGVENKINPGSPCDRNMFSAGERESLRRMPESLAEALQALEADADFLTRGDVFSAELIETWIATKRQEVAALRLRPHPFEFCLYFEA